MALELDKITFAVDTVALEQAVTKVNELKAALQQLNSGVQTTAVTATVKAQQQQTKAATEATQVVKELTQATKKVEEGSKSFAASTDKVTYTIQKQEIAMDVLRGTTLKLKDGELELQRIYTNGQANRIAALKLQGATTEQMSKYTQGVKDLNNIMGVNTFDKSAGGFEKISKSVKELQNVDELMREGLGLTRQQIILLSRDIESLRQSYVRLGQDTSGSQFANDVAIKKAQFAAEAQRENLLLERARESDRIAKEIANRQQSGTQMNDQAVTSFYRAQEDAVHRVAKAQAFLAQETMRAEQALLGLNEQVNISTSNRLNRFERHLHLAGVEADFAEAELNKYKQTLLETDRLNAEKNKKAQMSRLDYAARATSVQLGDIGISLAGGQNPLLVMIQQGDQLRAVLNDSALNAEELRKVMSNASAQIVRGFVDVGRALSSFVIGGFKDAGNAAAKFLMDVSGLNTFTDWLTKKVPEATGFVSYFNNSLKVLAAVGIAAFAVGLTTVLVALNQVIKQENEFVRALAMTGGQFKASNEEAYNYVRSIGALTKDTTAANTAIVEMAKVGGIVSDQIELVGVAAVKLSKSVGIPVEETVKKFGDLAKEPSKTLIELAKSTGLIDVETLKLVQSYEEVGKKSEAAKVATEAYANATKQAADTVQQNYGVLTSLARSTANVFNSMWDAILGVDRKMSTREKIDAIAKEIADIRDGKGFFGSGINGIGGRADVIATKQKQLDQLYKEVAAEIKVSEQKQEQANLSGKLENFWKSQEQFATNKAKREKEEKQYQENNLMLLEKKLITQKQYDQGLKDIATKYKDTPVARTAEEKFTDKSIRLFTRDAAEAEGKMNDLTKSQIDLLKVVSSPEWAKADHQKIIDAYQLALEIDIQNKKSEEQLKLYKQAIEAEKDYVDLLTKRHAENKAALITGMKRMDDAVEINNDLEFQMKIIGLTADEQKRLTAERKAYLELQKELTDIEKKGDGVDKNTLRAYANTAYDQKLKNIGTQSSLDKLIEADKLSESLAGAVVSGLTEGGKSGAAKLRNILQAELMKPITVFIQAQISGLMGGLSSGVTSLAGNQLSGILPAGFSVGNAANVLGAAYLATGLGKALSGGYQVGNAATTNGMSLLGGGATAGLVNRLLGRKLTDSGVQGQYSGNSFAGSNYTFSKGGLFRSDKTTSTALDPAMQQMLNRTYSGIDKTFTYFADKFDTTVSSSFEAIKVNLLGLSESEAQAKLSEAIAASTKKTLDAINLPKWAEDVLAELGDTFSVESMNTALSGVAAMKDALDALGAASSAFAGITSDATTELIAEFGGIQTATQNLASYYQNFYPEEQRIEIATTALNKQLAKLGVAIPDSTSAYKKLVDDALIAGNEELAANLINLSGAFYEVKSAIESMTQSVIDEADRLRGEIVGSNSSVSLGKNALLAEFGMLTELARGGDKSAMERLSEVSKSIEDLTKQQAVSQAEVTKMQSYLSQSLYATAQSLGSALPNYVSATTTNASTSDLSPLTATVQPAGNTASSTTATSQATNAARVEMLLTSLVDNISGLRDEIRADVSHNAKTAKILDRAMQDGQSLTVTVLA